MQEVVAEDYEMQCLKSENLEYEIRASTPHGAVIGMQVAKRYVALRQALLRRLQSSLASE